MNVYFVLSEDVSEVICEDWWVNACHEEWYRIADLVVARNHSQARYLALSHDKSWTGNIRDALRCKARKLGVSDETEARIVTNEPVFADWWCRVDGIIPDGEGEW